MSVESGNVRFATPWAWPPSYNASRITGWLNCYMYCYSLNWWFGLPSQRTTRLSSLITNLNSKESAIAALGNVTRQICPCDQVNRTLIKRSIKVSETGLCNRVELTQLAEDPIDPTPAHFPQVPLLARTENINTINKIMDNCVNLHQWRNVLETQYGRSEWLPVG